MASFCAQCMPGVRPHAHFAARLLFRPAKPKGDSIHVMGNTSMMQERNCQLIVEVTTGRKTQSQHPHLTDEQPPPPGTETPPGTPAQHF
ncbi:hypothetical protein J6590_044475 [Homalodisca vitripennis]|nr:hypothetical protein J6590_044475 [Homalodisca vitripennis]